MSLDGTVAGEYPPRPTNSIGVTGIAETRASGRRAPDHLRQKGEDILRTARAVTVIAVAALTLAGASVAAGQGRNALQLQQYTLEGEAEAISAATAGVELAGTRRTAAGIRTYAVLTRTQVSKLRASGVSVKLTRNAKGQTVQEQAALQQAAGFTVWRSWDEEGGIRDELFSLARQNPQLVKLEVLGRTHQGRELIALKVTQGAREVPDGSRPAVLYSSTQHAREWISTEVNRRLLHHFIDRWRANDKEIKNLLKGAELWFVLVANPDGYQYTFDIDRLWRKNLRDNNGDGQITVGDGVDPNRNFAEHWGYDDEGSSNDPADETYRGPSAGSEPETRFMAGLIDRIKPKFQSNFHSFGQWLLYPQGWQIGTLDADNPIYVALGGTDAKPAIPGFNPGQSADTLYVTNGETTDYADTSAGTIAYTPELGEGAPGAGFVFPDDEALIQAEFVKTRAFSLGLARSARNPADPVSPVGIGVRPFYLDQDDIDPQNGQQSLFDFKFAVSYGDPQEVRVLAKRSLGAVMLQYQINDGAVQSRPTSEWAGDERYGPGNDVYYHVVRGSVTGTAPGDSVKVWFTGGGATSDSFTYTVESDSGRRVLIVAAEDYTGASPVYADQSGPNYLSFYTDALTANGVAFDVYDVDAHGRTAPGRARSAEPLRRRRLVHGQRHRHAGARLGARQRVAARDAGDSRAARLRQCRRARALHGPSRRAAVHPGARRPVVRPVREQAVQCRRGRAGPLPRAAGLGQLARRPDRVHARRGDHLGGRRPRSGNRGSIRRRRHRRRHSRACRGGSTAPTARRTRLRTRRSSRPGTSSRSPIRRPASRSSTAGRRPSTGVGSPARSTRIRARRSCGRSAPTRRTSGCPGRSPCRPAARRCRSGRATTSSSTSTIWWSRPTPSGRTTGRRCRTPTATRRTTSAPTSPAPGGWSNPADAENVLHPFLTHYQTFDPATGTCSNTGSSGTVARGERELGRLAAVRDRPLAVRRFAGRGLDHRAERLGAPAVPRRVHRRHRRLHGRGQHVVRG